MNREFYQDLAKTDIRMVFGAKLLLHSHENYPEILYDGNKLGELLTEAGRTYSDPLGLPCMDPKVEKEYLLHLLGLSPVSIEDFYFEGPVNSELSEIVKAMAGQNITARMKAQCEAISFLKKNSMLIPVGSVTGPFSLMTAMLGMPIKEILDTTVGASTEKDPRIRDIKLLLEISTELIEKYIGLQIDAGAEAIIVSEPAVNSSYISTETLSEMREDIFDVYVLNYNQLLKKKMDEKGVDLILHCTGELSGIMIKKFCLLDPVIFSPGSSTDLLRSTESVPGHIILFGNLPSKDFEVLPADKLEEKIRQLDKDMKKTAHPFILGSDIMNVQGQEEAVREKVEILQGRR